MTVQLIRRTAKEYAGAFYEENRSDAFRRTYPTVNDYLRGIAHRRDGSVVVLDPGWWHFVDTAKGVLAKMLNDKSVSQHEKDRIYEQLLEEGERSQSREARRVIQTHTGHRET